MLRAPVRISHTAYEVLWERAELGVMPSALSIEYPLRSADSGAELARRAFAELNQLGLIREDAPHPDLSATLRLVARAGLRYWAILLDGSGRTDGPLIAVDGESAVLATLDDNYLYLHPIPAGAAVPTLIRQLPPAPPAAGPSLSIREDSIGADGKQLVDEESDSVLITANPWRTEADRLNELIKAPRTFVGYLYAAIIDGNGNQRRCKKPLLTFDVEAGGRWFLARQVRGGSAWLTAAPATAETLAAQLAELASGLR